MYKIPHKKVCTDYGWDYKPVELTGKCKRIIYPNGKSYEYVQCQQRIFGFKVAKYWYLKDLIVWSEQKKVEYYDCNISG